MTICERFFQLLHESGESQKKFSDKTGISPTTISAWKIRNTDPPAEKISTIADFFKISVVYLLTGTEESTVELSKNETELLDCYKQLDHRGQSRVTSTAFEELERIEAQYKKESSKYGAQAV